MKRLIYTFALLFVTLSMMAAKIPSGTQLYLKPNSNWKQSNAWFAAYFFGDGTAWVKMLDNAGDGIYSCKAPNSGKNYTNVIFCRINPSSKETSGSGFPNNCWDQTNDLVYDGQKDMYTIANGAWSYGSGTWSDKDINEIMYFVNTEGWTLKTLNFMLGHNTYSHGYEMSLISNTNLYYKSIDLWSDFLEWSVFNVDGIWGESKTESVSQRHPYATNNGNATPVGGRPLYDYSLLGCDGKAIYLSSYTDLNHTHTINITTDDKASTTGGTITVSSYNLTAENTASSTKGSASGTKTTISVVYTATVTLTATANTGYSFVGWYDENKSLLSSETTYSYTAPNSEKTISAKFKINTYTVTLKAENGTVTGAGTYNYGSKATITATPNDGYHFVQWSDGDKNASRTITVTKNTTLTAEFAINTYTVTLKAENGTVTGAGTYNHGTQVTIKATPNDGYHFVKWSDEDKNASRIITVTENTTYEAIFDKLCEFDELEEGTVYYIAAETINVANKYDKASIDMEKTSVDGLYQVTIPKGYFDRFVIGDKTFTSAQISTNQYYNDMEWLPFEASLDIPNQIPNSGLYGPITYQKTISGEDVNKWHWISLPYNVKISDIQGGEYGDDFIIQEYNTAERAEWEDNIAANNNSAWREMGENETLLAGKGYILAVNDAKSSYDLTFVSETDLNVVVDQFNGYNTDFSSSVPESANWHLIGTGVYGNAGGYENVNYVAKPDATGADYTYHFLGEELASNFNPTLLGVGSLEPYTAFFVQHAGEYSFSKAQPAQNAAPRRARAEEVVEQYYVNIVGMADTSHTAIFLAEDGSDDYVVGKDFLHLGASGASLQLYTLQDESTLSFNYLKREDRTVLVGGYVAQSGKYTISLDGNGEASSVLLYDMETGLVADLLNENYEFEAEKGILDGRFSVIISYAKGDGPATEVENDMTMGVVAVNCDGIARFEGLSIGENVAVYDVVGRCVTQFVAESDKADVMLTSGVYVLYHNGETVKFVVNR